MAIYLKTTRVTRWNNPTSNEIYQVPEGSIFEVVTEALIDDLPLSERYFIQSRQKKNGNRGGIFVVKNGVVAWLKQNSYVFLPRNPLR